MSRWEDFSVDSKTETKLTDLIRQAGLAPRSTGSLAPYFIVIRGGTPGTMLPLSIEGTTIGRSPGNGMQILEGSISRNHAKFTVDPLGEPRITDLGSANGSFLNGNQIEPNVPVRLRDGDRLQLGSLVVIKFVRLDPCEERFHKEMFDRTVRDGLTTLYKREYLFEQFGPLLARCIALGLGVAVMVIDIDHFKAINDQHGHDAGDEVLKEVCALLRHHARQDDLIVRYGGEEFVFALPCPNIIRAVERAEVIRRAVEQRGFEHQGQTIRMTLSIGLTFTAADKHQSITALISEADKKLLEAKALGRNQVLSTSSAANTMNRLDINGSPSSMVTTPMNGLLESRDRSLLGL